MIIVKDIIPLEIQRESVISIITRDVNSYTHGFHKYPAKFIPQIPRWAINSYVSQGKNQVILDPFVGSGTTLVEGLLYGCHVVGIDIDPLSILISKVKTTRLNEKKLLLISDWLIKKIHSTKTGSFMPDCVTLGHWFIKDAINKLSIIRTLINQIPEVFGDGSEEKDIQDLLIICFSSIIRKVSNADNESQKTYVSHTKIKNPEEVYSLFIKQLKYFIERALLFSRSIDPSLKVKIYQTSSSTSLDEYLSDINVNLVVTSPPYIKAIDYIYNQMIELFWIGDLFHMQTQTKQNSKKPDYIGNKHVQKADYIEYNPFHTVMGIEELDHSLQQVYYNDSKNGHRHSFIGYKYFVDMEAHFSKIAPFLSPDTHYIMVVGNSSVSGVYFDTANYLTQIAERNGFSLTNKWGYLIKNRFMRFDRKGRGGIIDIDWVLDFKKI